MAQRHDVGRVLEMSALVDPFLSCTGISSGSLPHAQYEAFWERLSRCIRFDSTSYLVCLVARLVALDLDLPGVTSVTPLVTRMLTEPAGLLGSLTEESPPSPIKKGGGSRINIAKPEDTRSNSELRMAIINTIYFITMFFPFDTNSLPLRVAFLQWSAVRGSVKVINKTDFEAQVFKLFAARDLWEGDEPMARLVEIGCGVGRASLVVGVQPTPPIPLYNNKQLGLSVVFSFLRRRTLAVLRSETIIAPLIARLSSVIDESHEGTVLPSLAMLEGLIITALYVDPNLLASAYRVVHRFFLWPAPYCEAATRILDLLNMELRAPGQCIRSIVFEENRELLKVRRESGSRKTEAEDQWAISGTSAHAHIIVDMATHGAPQFIEFFADERKISRYALMRIIILHIFQCFYGAACKLEGMNRSLNIIVGAKLEHLFNTAVTVMTLSTSMKEEDATTSGMIQLNDLEASILLHDPFNDATNKGDHDVDDGMDRGPYLSFVPPPMRFLIHEFRHAALEARPTESTLTSLNIPKSRAFDAVKAILTEETESRKVLVTSKGSDSIPDSIVRVVVGGCDMSLSNVMAALFALRLTEPALFVGLHIVYYFVPLGGSTDNTEHFFSNFLRHFDFWWDSQIAVLVESALHVYPTIRPGTARSRNMPRMPSDKSLLSLQRGKVSKKNRRDTLSSSGGSGSNEATTEQEQHNGGAQSLAADSLIRGSVESFLRFAKCHLIVKLFQAEIWCISLIDGSERAFSRTVPVFQRLELGFDVFVRMNNDLGNYHQTVTSGAQQGHALAGNSSSIGSNSSSGGGSSSSNSARITSKFKFVPPEVALCFSELSMGGTLKPGRSSSIRSYWSVILSHLPRTNDYCNVPNPASAAMEMFLIDYDSGRRTLKGKTNCGESGSSYQVGIFEAENKTNRPFSVLIDGQVFRNVFKVKVSPCRIATADQLDQDVTLDFATYLPSSLYLGES